VRIRSSLCCMLLALYRQSPSEGSGSLWLRSLRSRRRPQLGLLGVPQKARTAIAGGSGARRPYLSFDRFAAPASWLEWPFSSAKGYELALEHPGRKRKRHRVTCGLIRRDNGAPEALPPVVPRNPAVCYRPRRLIFLRGISIDWIFAAGAERSTIRGEPQGRQRDA